MFYLLVFGIVAVIGLIACLPIWPHSKQWSHGPSGFAAVVILIIFVLLMIYARH
jgi:hypothetical protein